MNATLDTGHIVILERFFRDLSAVNQRKIFTAGFRKAARPLVKTAKANAPVGRTGNLRRSIGTMMMRGGIGLLVGAIRARKGWHGHLAESGTTERIRKSGASTGRVQGTKFFERSFDQTSKQVYSEIEKEWYQAIDKFIIRTNKKL